MQAQLSGTTNHVDMIVFVCLIFHFRLRRNQKCDLRSPRRAGALLSFRYPVSIGRPHDISQASGLTQCLSHQCDLSASYGFDAFFMGHVAVERHSAFFDHEIQTGCSGELPTGESLVSGSELASQAPY